MVSGAAEAVLCLNNLGFEDVFAGEIGYVEVLEGADAGETSSTGACVVTGEGGVSSEEWSR